jgi:DNA-binding NarL/FixJ family response regulator
VRIDVHGGQVTVQDLDSRNGTFVDYDRVRRASVRLGQTLQIGSLSFVLAASVAGVVGLESKLATESEHHLVKRRADDPVFGELSAAQRRVVELILEEGLKNKELAKRLRISPNTVHNHLCEIYRIYGVHSRSELLVHLHRNLGNDGLTLS